MNKTIDKYITIEFNYDDDLGKLQQMTKDNLTFLEKLDSWEILHQRNMNQFIRLYISIMLQSLNVNYK